MGGTWRWEERKQKEHWEKRYFEGKRSKCCTIESEQQQYPLTFLELFFDQFLLMKVTLNLSVPASAQWKEKCSLIWTCLLQIYFDWLVSVSISDSLSSKSLWYWQLLQFTRSISSVRIDFYHTTYTIQQLSDISDLWNDRLAKQLQKNRNRPVIDSMIVICLLLSETSLFITCLPCCRIPPNNQSPWSSSPLPPSLDPPTNLSINNRWPIWNRNDAQKIERKPLVLPNSTLFTFCLLSSKKDF